MCLCLQHISCDAGGESPVRHECKTIPGSAQVQPRRQAGSVPGDRQQTSVLAFTLTGAGKRLFPSYEGGNSNTQRGYHWISLGGGKARSTSACEACAALRHLCRSPQTFTTPEKGADVKGEAEESSRDPWSSGSGLWRSEGHFSFPNSSVASSSLK